MDKSKEHNDSGNTKIRLEDLGRENIYKVPDNYFEELPGIIQSRVTKKTSGSRWYQFYLTPATGWKVALAAAILTLILVFAGVFNNKELTPEQMLAEVSLEDLIEYVEYSDISTEEILAELDMSEYDMEFMLGDDIRFLEEDDLEDIDMMDLYEEYGIEEDVF